MIVKKKIPQELNSSRLDLVISTLCSISKNEARKLIDRGGCRVNSKLVRVLSREVHAGEVL